MGKLIKTMLRMEKTSISHSTWAARKVDPELKVSTSRKVTIETKKTIPDIF